MGADDVSVAEAVAEDEGDAWELVAKEIARQAVARGKRDEKSIALWRAIALGAITVCAGMILMVALWIKAT